MKCHCLAKPDESDLVYSDSPIDSGDESDSGDENNSADESNSGDIQ